ncbi:MAG: hypothetical protein M1834_006675 [Cirrosporium novae-zelandiae]|nr:MAG: hypothetical protein M1834_006675 [Cirrosporium novae-zelandiae]
MSTASATQGRQSPPPETQTGAQQQDVPGSGKTGAAASDTQAKQSSDTTKFHGLESNPVHILEKSAHAKTSRDGRGEGI